MQTLLYAGNSANSGIPKCDNVRTTQTISREVSATDLAWLAGILDGEGSLECGISNWHYHNKARPNIQTINRLWFRIAIQNTDARMIKKISQIYKAMRMNFFYSLTHDGRNKKDNINRKPVVGIYVTSTRSVIRALFATLPYLINKKNQANYLFEIVNYRLSLGFHGSKKVLTNPKLNEMLTEYRKIKRYTPNPSTTTRRASEIFDIPDDDIVSSA